MSSTASEGRAREPTTDTLLDHPPTPLDHSGILKEAEKPSVHQHHGARVPTVIPPEHSARTLICCFDGTGDQFDADNSNIVQLVSLLKKDDRSKQMVYYQVRSVFF